MKRMNGGMTELPGVKGVHLHCKGAMMWFPDCKMRDVRHCGNPVTRCHNLLLKNLPCWSMSDVKFLCCCEQDMMGHLYKRMNNTKHLDYGMQGKMELPDQGKQGQQLQQHTGHSGGHCCSHQHYYFGCPEQHVPAALPLRLVRVGVGVRVGEGDFQPGKSCHWGHLWCCDPEGVAKTAMTVSSCLLATHYYHPSIQWTHWPWLE